MNCQEFGVQAKGSFAWATLLATLEWSNNITQDIEGNPNCGEMFGKKFVAAITYLVLPVIALVESVVRGFFAAIATLIGLFIPEGKCRNAYEKHVWAPLAAGAVVSFGTFASALVAFGYNFDTRLDEKGADGILNPVLGLLASISYSKNGENPKCHMPGPCCCSKPKKQESLPPLPPPVNGHRENKNYQSQSYQNDWRRNYSAFSSPPEGLPHYHPSSSGPSDGFFFGQPFGTSQSFNWNAQPSLSAYGSS